MITKEEIKKHFREHRKEYIAGAAGIAVGALAGALLAKKYGKPTIVKELTVEVGEGNQGQMVVNQIFQRITKYGRPVGRHGNPVREIDPNTGRTLHEYATQTLAALDAGVSNNTMTKHLNGIGGYDIKGRIFERMDLEWITDLDDMDMFDYQNQKRESAMVLFLVRKKNKRYNEEMHISAQITKS